MITANLLIEKGYFPRQLTPNFQSKELALHLSEIKNLLKGIKKNKRKQTDLDFIREIKGVEFTTSKTIKFNYPKSSKFRREFSIPNPLHQILLCFFIEEHLNEILQYCNLSELSLTRIEIDSEGKRAINTNLEEITLQKIIKSNSSKYLLKMDISRFYHTIYTHSIPWALHTKEVSKKIRDNSLLGNCLDLLVRNTQDAQTLGIPVGPDTSHIISEIIATSIDIEIQNKLGKVNGFRYRDDYYLYFDSQREAEELLPYVERVLKKYELDINQEKSEIKKLPEEIEPLWISEINSYLIRDEKKEQWKDLITYFSKVYSQMKKYSNEQVLKYSLKKISEIRIKVENWEIYESLLLNAMTIEPSVLPIVLNLLYRDKNNLNKDKVQLALNKIVEYNVNLENTFEVLCSLWGIKKLDLKLTKKVAEKILEVNNSLILITLLELNNKELIEDEIDISTLKKYMKKEELYTENWILVYEAYRKGWLDSENGKDYISQDIFFSILSNKNISFYGEDNFNHDEDNFFDWTESY